MKINVGAALLLLLALFLSNSVYAVSCRAPGVEAPDTKAGSYNVYVHLGPVYYGDRYVVYLGDYISCINHFGRGPADELPPVDLWRIQNASIPPSLVGFAVALQWYSTWYNFPITTTAEESWPSNSWTPVSFLAMDMNFSAGGAAGVVVHTGQLLATFTMTSRSAASPTSPYKDAMPITWNIYAQNDISLNARGCDVSSNNMTITLPDYTGAAGSAAIPLSVHCDQTVKVSYYLIGTTTDSANSIFSNTASASPATGIGVQLSSRSGVITTNNPISLGSVGPGSGPVDLGLTASYARTNGPVVAGNVQSLIGVLFVYE